MSHFVYILYSEKIDRYYIGYTSDVQKRLLFHNSDKNKIWSKRGRPWKLMITIPYEDKSSALKAEKQIKRMKSKKYIEDVIKNGQLG